MSRSRIDLKDKRVAGLVLALLAVVVIVNVRTFIPDLKRAAKRSVSVADEVSLPGDLDEAAHLAAARLASLQPGDAGLAGLADMMAGGDHTVVSRPVRDPFRPGPTPVTQVRTSGRNQTRATRQVPFSCTAVLLGGSRPAALIDGKFYQVGDQLSAYRLVHISREGALLRGVAEEVFLPVRSPDSAGISYPLVTGTSR
jgi:hypothetical protein